MRRDGLADTADALYLRCWVTVRELPRLFLGAVWFGYKRFVDLELADMQSTDLKTGPEDHAAEDEVR